YANRRLEQHWGMPVSALLGRGWETHVPNGESAQLLLRWREAFEKGTDVGHAYRLTNGEGVEARWLHGRTAPLRDEEGRELGSIGAIQDVTERVLAEEALRASE